MIHGKHLMAVVNDVTIAMATDCSLDVQTTLGDSQTKDDDETGIEQEVTGLAATVKTSNLLACYADGKPLNNGYEYLLDLMLSKANISINLDYIPESAGKSTETSWEDVVDDWSVQITGYAIIESLELNAPNKENASMSASFKFIGKPVIGDD